MAGSEIAASQDDEHNDRIAAPLAESKDPNDCTSDAPLISSYGDIEAVWPDGCDNELPELKETQTRSIIANYMKGTVSMYGTSVSLSGGG
jgi:hypothetical protein